MENWTESPADPWIAREAEIRSRVASYGSLEVQPESLHAMLRDCLVRIEHLTGALASRRVETLYEAGELLRLVDHAAAADLVEAQLLVDHLTQASGRPVPLVITERIWKGLARQLPSLPGAGDEAAVDAGSRT